jgi:hypothetical protein
MHANQWHMNKTKNKICTSRTAAVKIVKRVRVLIVSTSVSRYDPK